MQEGLGSLERKVSVALKHWTERGILERTGWSVLANDTTVFADDDWQRTQVVHFVRESEEYATWDIMLSRAREQEITGGLAQAEIIASRADVPTVWRTYKLVFPGTVLRSRTGHLHCPYMRYSGQKWTIDLYWFLYDFHHDARFLRFIA